MAKQNKIPVFQKERDAGLEELVKTSGSIAYMSKVQDIALSQEVCQAFLKSIANTGNTGGETDQFDLFYLNTILVTTGWNKNDDVFDTLETWNARYTPIHKQFNLEHDQSKIIGHMTSAKAVDEAFNLISDATTVDSLPSKFHILTGAVIYREYSDEKAKEQIEQIIAEIGEGEWYVSMECLFRGFDYAVTAKSGEQKVIPRDEGTSFLTKNLRCYGGTGTYDDFTIGRCLKNITFSGKGLVRKPANPESIIFNENISAFRASFANLGYITSMHENTSTSDINSNSKQESVMANASEITVDTLNAQMATLMGQMNAVSEENKALKDKVKEFESSATTAKITSLESELSSKSTLVSGLEAELTNLKASVTELETKLSASQTKASELETELKKVKLKETTLARTSLLIEKGADQKEADALVAQFADKDDASFDTIVAIFAPRWEASKTAAAAAANTNTTTVVTPPAKTEPAVVVDSTGGAAVGGTNTEVESTREKMAKIIASILEPESDDDDDNSK